MSQERLPMVKIREVLRLQAEGLKQRQIAAEHVNGLETHLFTSLTSNWV
jgi:hypothetical protein